ncbi:sigma-54 interaction domain-containing protein [Mailhella sp.]|uniref:sigma-54 interaction domain-containing protein n=1 Tax=Mailhella sp. TaxID=1981029 RepID=UPI004062BA13
MTPDGFIKFCNKSFYESLGLTQDIVGKHSSEFFLTASSGVMTSIQTQSPVVSIGITVHGRQGIAFRFPVLNEDGSLQGILCESIPLPFCPQKSEALIEAVRQFQGKQDRKALKKPRCGELYTFADIVGTSATISAMKQRGRLFARGNEPVLLCGESGTGKELAAQALHMASPRADKPFVAVNCAALPSELIEAELFGYESGAFTGARAKGLAGKFEMANGGTIFLDEIGELPLAIQAKLLRALESGEIQKLAYRGRLYSDFRLICATNRNLDEMVKQNKFRADLYHRIAVFEMTVPPLRERLDDLPLLCRHFFAEFHDRRGNGIRLSSEVLSFFCTYSWPGNLRELRNVLQYAMHVMDGETLLKLEHLPPRLLQNHLPEYELRRKAKPSSKHQDSDEAPASFDMQRASQEAEKAVLLKALQTSGNNKALAARILNISRTLLYQKLKKYGIAPRQ